MNIRIGLLCLLCMHGAMYGVMINLSDAEIEQIYAQFIKPNFTEEYKLRYVPLPLEKNNNKSWKWENRDFPRVIAVLEFDRFIKAHNISYQKGLAINGIDPEWSLMPRKKIVHINYQENPATNNLHTLKRADDDFDFVMINQTLEHVYDPITCLKNVHALMRPGGILYMNVPANSILHSMPFHYYTGYTPVGLGAVVKAAGFEILSIGQWGNWDYMLKMFETQNWPDYRCIKNPGYNDVRFPIITWIFAIK